MKRRYKKKEGAKRGEKKPKILPKYLTKSEISNILGNAKKSRYRDYLILLTLWRTGIRVSEVVKIKKENFKDGNLLIKQGKGKKDRIVPVESELGNILGLYMDQLKNRERVFPMTDRNVRYIVNKNTPSELHAYPHIFRHSFAVYCLKNGVNLRSLQKILGHSNLETTAEYLDLLAEDVKEDFDKVEW